MSKNQSQIFLVLHSNNKEKKIEITERPKKLSHLQVLVQKTFDVYSPSLSYFIHFNDQKIELNDDKEELLLFFYDQSNIIEIHIIANQQQESWMNVDNMPMFESQKISSTNMQSLISDAVMVDSEIDPDQKENIEKFYQKKV